MRNGNGSAPGSDGWILVDTLSDGQARVVYANGRPKSRSSLERAIRDRVGGRLGEVVTAWAEREIQAARESGHDFDRTSNLATGGETRLVGRLIVGPRADVHGIFLWVGRGTDKPRSNPPTCSAFSWDCERRLVELPSLSRDVLQRTGLHSDRSTFTLPEVFRYLYVDDALTLISKVLEPQPESSWEGTATIRGVDDLDVGHFVVVSRPEPNQREWRGIVYAGISTGAAVLGSLESATLEAMPRVAPSAHMVLVDVLKMRLIRWITDPIPNIQWKGMVDNRDAPHPDDVARVFAAAADVFTGKDDRASVRGVRLRRFGGGWTVIDGVGALLPHEGAPQLALVEMTVVGTSNDPDLVPVTDGGHPGLDLPADDRPADGNTV